MNRYIMFNQSIVGENGINYYSHVKYKIKREDIEYIYLPGDKINKAMLDNNLYKIADIIIWG